MCVCVWRVGDGEVLRCSVGGSAHPAPRPLLSENSFQHFMRACVRVCVGVGREKVCTATGAAAAAAFDGVFVSKDKCEPLNLQAGGWGRTSGDREEPRTHCVTTGLNSSIRRKRVPITNLVFSERHVYFMIMKSSY